MCIVWMNPTQFTVKDEFLSRQTNQAHSVLARRGMRLQDHAALLRAILANAPLTSASPIYLWGRNLPDDAAVYRLNESRLSVATRLLHAIVDDPFDRANRWYECDLRRLYAWARGIHGARPSRRAVGKVPVEVISASQPWPGGVRGCRYSDRWGAFHRFAGADLRARRPRARAPRSRQTQ